MRRFIVALVFMFLASSAEAQNVAQLCQNVTTGGVTTCLPVSSSNPLSITATGGVVASSVAIGTTAITGGTNNYILYNNSGSLGNEATVSVAQGGTGATTAAGAQANLAIPTAQYGQGFGTPLSITCAGYSICGQQSYNGTIYNSSNLYPTTGYDDVSALTWAQKFSGGRLFFNLADGYSPGTVPASAVVKWVVLNGGTGYKNTDTATATGGCSVANPIPGAITVDSNGAITSVGLGTQGYDCTSLQTLTITTSTGSGASIFGVVGGLGNFGNAGENSTQFLARIQDVVNAKSNIILLNEGEWNDYGAGIPIATTEANLIQIWATLLNAGKIVIDETEGPANTSVGMISASEYKVVEQLDVWRKNYIRKIQSTQTGGGGRIISFDVQPEITDASSSAGASLPNMLDTTIGIHPMVADGMIQGWKLWQQLKPLLGQYDYVSLGNQIDVYDATYNPYGWLTSDPWMKASGGTTTSACTGTTASGWTLRPNSGTETGTCTASLEGAVVSGTRTDLYSGSRQVINISTGGSLTNHEQYLFFQNPSLASINLSVGNTITGSCDIEVSNTTNLTQLQFSVLFQNAGYTTLGFDFNGGENPSPMDNSGKIGGLDPSKPMTLTLFPMVIPTGTTQISYGVYMRFDGSGAANSATGTFKITNCGLRLAP